MALSDGRPSLYDLNPGRYSNSRQAGRETQQRIDAQRASPEYRAREAGIRAALGLHHDSVPRGSNSTGNHFNPDQKRDDHGRFD